MNQERETTGIEREVLEYLNELRSSGTTNMFGAAPYIQAEFPEIDRKESVRLFTLWMENFNEEGNYELVKS
jgi:hypothetical protein